MSLQPVLIFSFCIDHRCLERPLSLENFARNLCTLLVSARVVPQPIFLHLIIPTILSDHIYYKAPHYIRICHQCLCYFNIIFSSLLHSPFPPPLFFCFPIYSSFLLPFLFSFLVVSIFRTHTYSFQSINPFFFYIDILGCLVCSYSGLIS